MSSRFATHVLLREHFDIVQIQLMPDPRDDIRFLTLPRELPELAKQDLPLGQSALNSRHPLDDRLT